MGTASDSWDAGFELTLERLYFPPPAGRSLARLCLSHQPARLSARTRAGLSRQDPPLRFWPDWRGLFFVFCPAPELPRRPELLAPWAWEGRLGNGTRRESHRGHGAETRSCNAAVRESRGSEASTRPVSGRDTAMDPGQGWTRGNRKWQRAPRVRRVAEKNTSKEPEPQKSSPGWLGVTPQSRGSSRGLASTGTLRLLEVCFVFKFCI